MSVSLFDYIPRFTMPPREGNPFNAMAGKIIFALERRNWNVPGFEVAFCTLGQGHAKTVIVEQITYFEPEDIVPGSIMNRIELDIPDVFSIFLGCRGIYEFISPYEKFKLSYDSPDSPTLEAEIDEFRMTNGRLIRKYLMKRLSSILQLIERTPLPENIDPLAYYTREIKVPITRLRYPLDNYYVAVDSSTYERVKYAKTNGANHIAPNKRFALSNEGCTRLLSLDIPGGPKIAYDEFIWCSRLVRPLDDILSERNPDRDIFEVFLMPDVPRPIYGLLRIRPKYANYCFIADNAIYVATRNAMWSEIAPRMVLTDAELNQLYLKRAYTITPLTAYKGSYEQPFLLINRELDFDEVELAGIFTP